MFVVWFGLDSLPCVVHETLNIRLRSRAVSTNNLLPIMEDGVVERRETLRSIRRQQQNILDGLRTAVVERFFNGGQLHGDQT